MYNHNKAQQSKNRVHISWDILYTGQHALLALIQIGVRMINSFSTSVVYIWHPNLYIVVTVPVQNNSLRPGDSVWWHRSGWKLAQIFACYLTHSTKILFKYLECQWVNVPAYCGLQVLTYFHHEFFFTCHNLLSFEDHVTRSRSNSRAKTFGTQHQRQGTNFLLIFKHCCSSTVLITQFSLIASKATVNLFIPHQIILLKVRQLLLWN